MDIIINCHALFELIKKLALGVLLPAPFQTQSCLSQSVPQERESQIILPACLGVIK